MSCLCSMVDVASPHGSTTALVVRPTCTGLTGWTPVPCSRAAPLPGKFLQIALDRSTPLPGPNPCKFSSAVCPSCPAEEPREEPQAMHRDLCVLNAYSFHKVSDSEHCFTNRVLHMYTQDPKLTFCHVCHYFLTVIKNKCFP